LKLSGRGDVKKGTEKEDRIKTLFLMNITNEADPEIFKRQSFMFSSKVWI